MTVIIERVKKPHEEQSELRSSKECVQFITLYFFDAWIDAWLHFIKSWHLAGEFWTVWEVVNIWAHVYFRNWSIGAQQNIVVFDTFISCRTKLLRFVDVFGFFFKAKLIYSEYSEAVITVRAETLNSASCQKSISFIFPCLLGQAVSCQI